MAFVKGKLYGTVMHDSQPTPAPRSGKDEKRAAILGIAYAAFLADGYAATSMSSIAARVGGSKATLYNYFQSKEELFAAVVREKCEEFFPRVLVELNEENYQHALVELGCRFLAKVFEPESIATYRLVTAESVRFPEIGRAFYNAGPVQVRRWLASNLERLIANGRIRPGDTMKMAELFFDLCMSGLHQSVLWSVAELPTAPEMRANAERGVRVFLAAYGA